MPYSNLIRLKQKRHNYILAVFFSIASSLVLNSAIALCCDGTLHVALDVGHSKEAYGTPSASGGKEFEFNARFVKELLTKLEPSKRIQAKAINLEGRNLSLSERPRLAKAYGADVFVSIHHDSVNEKYLETKIIDGKKLIWTDKFHGFSIFVSKRNKLYTESKRIAGIVGRELLSSGFTPSLHHAEQIPGENRDLLDSELGIYDAPFAVIRLADMPAILVELGVITNPSDEKIISSDEGRARLVDSIAQALDKVCLKTAQ